MNVRAAKTESKLNDVNEKKMFTLIEHHGILLKTL